jgi:hypothetical protein
VQAKPGALVGGREVEERLGVGHAGAHESAAALAPLERQVDPFALRPELQLSDAHRVARPDADELQRGKELDDVTLLREVQKRSILQGVPAPEGVQGVLGP